MREVFAVNDMIQLGCAVSALKGSGIEVERVEPIVGIPSKASMPGPGHLWVCEEDFDKARAILQDVFKGDVIE
jgi:hypothetical protein